MCLFTYLSHGIHFHLSHHRGEEADDDDADDDDDQMMSVLCINTDYDFKLYLMVWLLLRVWCLPYTRDCNVCHLLRNVSPPQMELVSDWWNSSLAEAHYACLRQKELVRLPTFHARSPQLGTRLHVVDWLAILCDATGVCTTARHLSVALLDFFMDHFVVDKSQLTLVALSCLHIAGLSLLRLRNSNGNRTTKKS